MATLLSAFVFYCTEALAQCSLTIESAVKSGWSKDRVSYTVEKHTLKIKVGEVGTADADSIYIGSIKGCSTLTVEVSQISGTYPWDGKAIGFSFFNDKLEPHKWGNQASFPTPRGRAIEDGFVKAGALNNAKFVYDIANKASTTHIGAKVFIGSNNALELKLSAQDALPVPPLSLREPARPSKRYAGRTDHQSDAAAVSCSMTCHEPRPRHSEFDFTRDVSIPADADCPDESD